MGACRRGKEVQMKTTSEPHEGGPGGPGGNPSLGPVFFNEISAVPVVPVVPAKINDWKTKIPHEFFLSSAKDLYFSHKYLV
jgi:hypothetical protein